MEVGDLNLREEYTKIVSVLQTLGLSNYEARVYIALVAHGFGDAETIANTAGIPRTSSYKALQSLCSKGFAFSTSGRPSVYKPELPERMKYKVVGEVSEAFDKLGLIHEIVRDKGEPQLVFTITGKNRVMTKIGELLDKSSEKFVVATPTFSEIREAQKKKLEAAIRRGIRVTIITEPGQKVPEGSHVHWRKGLIATDIIVDGNEALIASPDLNACGFTDNPYLARHLEDFLSIMIAHGQE
ncbi:MAG: TrmB family transcriptional regulator [Thermoplasmata archaeon]